MPPVRPQGRPGRGNRTRVPTRRPREEIEAPPVPAAGRHRGRPEEIRTAGQGSQDLLPSGGSAGTLLIMAVAPKWFDLESVREVAMGQAVHRRPHLTLNTDGRAHPRENALAVTTLLLGLVTVLATAVGAYPVGVAAGLLGSAVGAWAQLVSATTAERWLIVFGAGASFVGLGLSLAFGGR